jgi:hypothetical protein
MACLNGLSKEMSVYPLLTLVVIVAGMVMDIVQGE